MENKSQPSAHQLFERQFCSHVEQLLLDDRLRIDTTRGLKPITSLILDKSIQDHGVELKRLMSEMGKPDRQLEAQMPVGQSIEVTLSAKKWMLFKTLVGRLRVVCVSPTRALLAGEQGQPMTAAEVTKTLGEAQTGGRGPWTIVVMSTSGFEPQARETAQRSKDRTVILACPVENGGWMVWGPPETKAITDLFDPEAEGDKSRRIRAAIEAGRFDLLSGGLASDKIAAKTGLTLQQVESELKSYARETPGLVAKRLDGRVVLFREGVGPLAGGVSAGGFEMPMIDRIKALFSKKGEIEKKVAFLSERRAALSQQRDRGYDDMGALEAKEGELRKEFKEGSGDLTRRRITSQLVQLRKDIERRQQLLGVLNQQINVVSTHLHNLELQQQGKTANLPDSDEVAADAAAAEEVLAELEANNELADSVGSTTHAGMSEEEQALYDELMAQSTEEKDKAGAKAAAAPAQPEATARKNVPPQSSAPERRRGEAEAG